MAIAIDAGDFVKSKYMKAKELDRKTGKTLQIKEVTQEEFPEQGKKLVIAFNGFDQLMVCNKTQVNSLIDYFGRSTAKWEGQWVQLKAVPSGYQNTLTILVLAAEPPVAPKRSKVAAPPVDEDLDESDQEDEADPEDEELDELPFK